MLQTIWLNNYTDFNIDALKNIYGDTGYYVFRRKMHNSAKYHAYLKANTHKASIETLTMPAFPTYLLPPTSIIEEIEKSPKLNNIDKNNFINWNDAIGEFYCNMKNIVFDNKKYLTNKEKLLKHLNTNKKNTDEYIYSMYIIDKLDNTTFFCSHIIDITMKKDRTYSEKSSMYSQNIAPYTVKIENGLINSEFGRSF